MSCWVYPPAMLVFSDPGSVCFCNARILLMTLTPFYLFFWLTSPFVLSFSIVFCLQLNSSGLLGSTELSVGTALACFLAQEGADINYANHKGKSPLDLVTDSTMLQLIKTFSEKHRCVFTTKAA